MNYKVNIMNCNKNNYFFRIGNYFSHKQKDFQISLAISLCYNKSSFKKRICIQIIAN